MANKLKFGILSREVPELRAELESRRAKVDALRQELALTQAELECFSPFSDLGAIGSTPAALRQASAARPASYGDAQDAEIFDRITRSRRSIRGFLPQPVEADKLEHIFRIAAHAPSNCNTQPWQSHVVSGETRDRLSRVFMETVGEGEYSLDFPYDAKYEGEYRKRQLDVGILLYQALGVTREDKEGKRRAFLRNLEFFDAPHVVFLFMPDWCGIREACDVGMYAQNLMLSMQAHGVASCPQTILGYNADVVREAFGIGAELKLIFGISFGLEDTRHPANEIVPARATLEENTHFFNEL